MIASALSGVVHAAPGSILRVDPPRAQLVARGSISRKMHSRHAGAVHADSIDRRIDTAQAAQVARAGSTAPRPGAALQATVALAPPADTTRLAAATVPMTAVRVRLANTARARVRHLASRVELGPFNRTALAVPLAQLAH